MLRIGGPPLCLLAALALAPVVDTARAPPVDVAVETPGDSRIEGIQEHQEASVEAPGDPGALPTAGIEDIVANDLHGLHDLLLVGFAGMFVRDPTTTAAGQKALGWIQGAVRDLMDMLPVLHPVPVCQTKIRDTIKAATSLESRVSEVALATWTCLPASFSAESFSATFGPDALGDRTLQIAAKNPKVLPDAKANLGACRESVWDRTCSYWSILHILAAKAEMAGTGAEFLRAAILAIFGGATMCKGWHRHFRMFHMPLMSDEVVQGTYDDADLQKQLWTGAQCGSANGHMSSLMACMQQNSGCDEHLNEEIADIQAYHAWLSESAMHAPFATTVILHNLVSSTVGEEFVRGGVRRYACVEAAAQAISSSLLGGVTFRPSVPEPPVGKSLPGVGKHRFIDCR